MAAALTLNGHDQSWTFARDEAQALAAQLLDMHSLVGALSLAAHIRWALGHNTPQTIDLTTFETIALRRALKEETGGPAEDAETAR